MHTMTIGTGGHVRVAFQDASAMHRLGVLVVDGAVAAGAGDRDLYACFVGQFAIHVDQFWVCGSWQSEHVAALMLPSFSSMAWILSSCSEDSLAWHCLQVSVYCRV